jgi:hypothetical protein
VFFINLQRYEKVGIFADDGSPCFIPSPDGDYVKLRSIFAYRPLIPDLLLQARARIKRVGKNLIMCNDATWFFHLTSESHKVRQSYDLIWREIRLMGRRLERAGFKAFIMPEQGTKGQKSWHIHGILFGVGHEIFCQQVHQTTGKPYVRFIDGIQDAVPVFSSRLWTRGFSQFVPIDHNPLLLPRMAIYMTKYITKDLIKSTPNRARYFRSRGLSINLDDFLDKVFLET